MDSLGLFIEQNKTNHMNKFLSGALAGFIATIPMTGAMLLLHDHLPRSEKHPLPPELITERIAKRLPLAQVLNKSDHQLTTWAAHFTFGSAAGIVYGSINDKVPANPIVKGSVFGLLVWAISYLGWLPQTGILNQPHEQPARLNWLMIVAHLVWGATLGLLTNKETHK